MEGKECIAESSELSGEEESGHERECLKLFGKTIGVEEKESMRKRKSKSNESSASCNAKRKEVVPCHSRALIPNKVAAQPRKKPNPWTEEEHRLFLEGLEKVGRGHWKEISEEYVRSRIPSQVASHAQKYFMRMANRLKMVTRRHSKIFDNPLPPHHHRQVNFPTVEAPASGGGCGFAGSNPAVNFRCYHGFVYVPTCACHCQMPRYKPNHM